ncbi:MAG: menaquinone biosynthesis decarboxylase [bacterium]
MFYKDLRDYIKFLEEKNKLVRVKAQVSSEMEVVEISNRMTRSNGPVLLFENVSGSKYPVLINAFGSMEKMAYALGVTDLDEIRKKIEEIVRPKIPDSFFGKVRSIPKFYKMFRSFRPKNVSDGVCQEIVKKDSFSLDEFPILKYYPKDGGRYITLPLVITRDPETGIRNAGMYRMQVFDGQTCGMHWHPHKDGARHYQKAEKLGRRLEVAVAVGSDTATTYAAAAPLPQDIDEFIFAGFLRGSPVELVKCRTVDLEVPANSEIVLEGYIEPGERRLEGPFGDHTGHYSLPDYFPVFHLTCVTHRKDAIYHTVSTGIPPVEDNFLGKATERIFLPLVKLSIPEITDMNFPLEGGFHNIVIFSIKKSYPWQAHKIMHAVWGLGQMMFSKIVIIVDDDVNVSSISDVLWNLGNNIDPGRDIVTAQGPADILDFSSLREGFGTKIGIDATRKFPEELDGRSWPEKISRKKEIIELVEKRWREYGF